MIPYARHSLDEDDIQSVLGVLKSGFLTQGPSVTAFESSFANYCGAKYAVAVSSGTAALHIAVQALDCPKESEVITSPITFVATSNAALYNDLVPVFSDINPDTICLDPNHLDEVISPNSKVIIPVHFAGQPCDMVAIKAFADKHNLYVIEDACHALGGTYKGAPIGNCTYSDMSVFSLHPAKSIAAGEGGVITTNDKGLYDTLIRLRSHGITKAPDLLTQNPGPWYYEMHDLGYNYRLTDIQSALASSQLSKLDRFVTRRREIKDMYNNAFSDQPYVSPLVELEPNSSAWHLYVLRIDFDKLGKSRKTVMEELVALGIGSQVHYIPVPSQPYYVKNNNSRSGDVPQSMDFYNQALSIPMFPSLTEIEINTVIAAVKSVIA